MMRNRHATNNRDVVWLTVTYSQTTGLWFIETTDPTFMTRTLAKEFFAVEGAHIIYMVRGFDYASDAKEFAIDYHEAKSDGFVSRIRLD